MSSSRNPKDWSDEEIKDALHEIDDDEDTWCNDWEKEFLQSVLFEWDGDLTPGQRTSAARIIRDKGFN